MLKTRRLNKYAKTFNRSLEDKYLSTYENGDVRELLDYSLSGGKRMRPAIIYDIFYSLGKGGNVIDGSYIAFTTELIHSSSLIIDDLPCMDNDDVRRGRETVHKRYGILAAKMVSTLLISDAHSMLFKMYDTLRGRIPDLDERMLIVLENITTNIGIEGAAYGQYLDMIPKYSNEFRETMESELENYSTDSVLQQIIEKKTGVIFEIAFISAYVFGGGDLQYLEDVIQASHDFGRIFQIYDDLKDESEDRERMVNGLTPNYVIRFGRKHSLQVISQSIYNFRNTMIKVGLYSKFFNDMMLHIYRGMKSQV